MVMVVVVVKGCWRSLGLEVWTWVDAILRGEFGQVLACPRQEWALRVILRFENLDFGEMLVETRKSQ